MSFKLIDNHLTPAEGEVTVRTYHCTTLSPAFALIGLKINGHLTVTNKRVVYFAEGSSLFGAAGNSKLYNEVPVTDVANLSFGRGTRFSFLRLLCGLLFGQIPAAIITLLLAVAMTAIEAMNGGGNPYLLRARVFFQLLAAVLLVFRSFSVPRENIVRLMLVASALAFVVSAPALAIARGGAVFHLPPVYQLGMAIIGIPLFGYWLWCLYWFIRREYFLMGITSKSGRCEPIKVEGVSWWGRRNHAAEYSRGMAPAVDADALFRELGAMVTDIQTMGDIGIEKWMLPEPDPNAAATAAATSTAVHPGVSAWYATVTIVVLALLVGGETLWYASGAQEMLARQMRDELAAAEQRVKNDPSNLELVPKMLASAELEATAGESAFQRKVFPDCMAHWQAALNIYTNVPSITAALKNAAILESNYRAGLADAYLHESASERYLKTALMRDFAGLMDQHPTPNESWTQVKLSTQSAGELREQEKWEQTVAAWQRAGQSLPYADQLMRADVWVSQAETELKQGNASSASNYIANALNELPGYPDALQRSGIVRSMLTYDQWLGEEAQESPGGAVTLPELTKRLDLSGGEEWGAIRSLVDNARNLAIKNEWVKCADEWKNALSRMSGAFLSIRMETEARRGNWLAVSKLARRILWYHPDDVRANELKTKADGIESARVAELAYRQGLLQALGGDVTNNYVKLGNLTDLLTGLDRYGKEEWAQIKDSIGKAEAFRTDEQGPESSAEWTRAIALFPSALQRMRAEIWMEQAQNEVKNNHWAKVLVYAQNALNEKSDLTTAKQLRDQADALEEKRLRQVKKETKPRTLGQP